MIYLEACALDLALMACGMLAAALGLWLELRARARAKNQGKNQ